MSRQIKKVLPGDLITATFVNSIVDEVNELQNKIASLEAINNAMADSVVITELIPSSGVVRVGSVLQVLGKNFNYSVGGHRVLIDDTRVNIFEVGSNDRKLVFQIPDTFVNVPLEGRSAVLTISNLTSTTRRTIVLESSQILSGEIDVIPRGVKSGTQLTPTPGALFVLEYKLRSRANIPALSTLSASVKVGGTPNETWQNNTQFVNQSDVIIPSRQVTLKPGEEQSVYLRINPVPSTAAPGTQFSVLVTADSGNIRGTSGEQSFAVGTQSEQPDNTISMNYSSSSRVSPVSAENVINSTKIKLGSTGRALVVFDAEFTRAGTYTVSSRIPAATQNWQASNHDTTSEQIFITDQDLAFDGKASFVLEYIVRPVLDQGGPPSTTGEVEFIVQRNGSAVYRSYKMQLEFVQ